jgi:hypothetical protein
MYPIVGKQKRITHRPKKKKVGTLDSEKTFPRTTNRQKKVQ